VRIAHALVMTAAICMAGVVTTGRASAQGRNRNSSNSGDESKADTSVKKPGEPGGPMDPERPIPFLIEHRKEIPLADSQVSKLGIIQSRLDAADRPAHLALDTLPDASTKIDWAHITPAGRDSIIARRRAVSQANAMLHDNALSARNDAFAALTPDQVAKMRGISQSIVNKQLTPSHPSSTPAPGGMGGGQPGGGGRPY
jgi:hypothetical protein